jgi:hypothetical protein
VKDDGGHWSAAVTAALATGWDLGYRSATAYFHAFRLASASGAGIGSVANANESLVIETEALLWP